MAQNLINKHILLGVTGSIAAYKSADLVRRLREAGAVVRVAMTENAKRFITPLTMQAVSGNPIHDDLFDLTAEAAMGHIELARWADLILIAPATADFMARLLHGNANDLLTTVCLATKAPVAIAPAMNQGMWNHKVTQQNCEALKQNHIHIIGPAQGSQACGDVGFGRMLEPVEILEKVNAIFTPGILSGLNLLITAGPTHEAIDPIRFITNHSSGKMGYALADSAHEAGANVTLISGPVHLPKPDYAEFIPVITAQEMFDAVMTKVNSCDIFLSVAAVGDYKSQSIAAQKIHKSAAVTELKLERNPDIVASVGQLTPKPFIVGFAAETENVVEQARKKYQNKNMDMMIANRISKNEGMGTDDNAVTVISPTSEVTLTLMSKNKLARELIAMIATQYKQGK